MKAFIVAIFSLVPSLMVFADGLRAEAIIEASGALQGYARTYPGSSPWVWMVRLRLTNASDRSVTVGLYSCSWYIQLAEIQDAPVEIDTWECRANYPIEREIKPGESFNLWFPIRSRTSVDDAVGTKVKFGFLVQRMKRERRARDELFDPPTSTVWTDELTVPPMGNAEIYPWWKMDQKAQPGATDNPGDAQ